jgi:hypothetical protein
LKFSYTENEPVIHNHQLSCYTSRKIDYSAKLNEILNYQGELSSKIIINKIEENNESQLSESLGKVSLYIFIYSILIQLINLFEYYRML